MRFPGFLNRCHADNKSSLYGDGDTSINGESIPILGEGDTKIYGVASEILPEKDEVKQAEKPTRKKFFKKIRVSRDTVMLVMEQMSRSMLPFAFNQNSFKPESHFKG